MLDRIEAMRRQYAATGIVLAILDELAKEPEMYRNYADYYSYAFFVACRPL